jgi:hypothetical protein
MVTRTIEQGHHITASDLGSVGVSTSGGVTPVPVADASELSGKWAAETIPAGSLLTLGDVTSARPLPVGTAVVGLALKDGQMPSGGVLPGDQVMMVQTPGAGAVLPYAGSADSSSGTADGGDANGADATSGVLVAQATVFDVATPSASSSGTAELVSVEVPSTLAASVATASAADQVSVVLLPAGPADTASSAFSNGTGTGPGSQDGGSS